MMKNHTGQFIPLNHIWWFDSWWSTKSFLLLNCMYCLAYVLIILALLVDLIFAPEVKLLRYWKQDQKNNININMLIIMMNHDWILPFLLLYIIYILINLYMWIYFYHHHHHQHNFYYSREPGTRPLHFEKRKQFISFTSVKVKFA